jgi:hypothetical protein
MERLDAVEVGFCETYEKLLEEREAARHNWNEQRVAIFELGLRGKEMDDELLSLQARFAKANALVCNHLRDCRLCESARRAGHAGGPEGRGHGGNAVRLPLSSFLAFLVPGRHS